MFSFYPFFFYRTIGFKFILECGIFKPWTLFSDISVNYCWISENHFYYFGWDKTFRILVLSHDRDLNIRWYRGSKGQVQDNWYTDNVNASSTKDNGI